MMVRPSQIKEIVAHKYEYLKKQKNKKTTTTKRESFQQSLSI